MQSTSRAPVLSATLRRDSCWIMGLPGPLQDLDQAPALGAAERAAFDHAHGVAHVCLVLLVVGVQRGAGPDDLLVHAVLAGDVDADGDRLVGLVRDDDALAHLELAARPGLGGRRLGTRLTGAALAKLLTIGPAMPRLALPLLGPLPRPLLGRPRRPRLTCVKRARPLAPLLGRELLLGLGRLGGSLRPGSRSPRP